MRVTREEDYAITLMTAFAHNYGKGYLSLHQIAKAHRLPEPFLKQIVQKLKATGLLSVKEGRGGGYRLTKSPNQISAEQVLRVFSTHPFLTSCLDQRHKIKCGIYNQCQTRKTWQKISEEFYQSLKNIDLEKLAKR